MDNIKTCFLARLTNTYALGMSQLKKLSTNYWLGTYNMITLQYVWLYEFLSNLIYYEKKMYSPQQI